MIFNQNFENLKMLLEGENIADENNYKYYLKRSREILTPFMAAGLVILTVVSNLENLCVLNIFYLISVVFSVLFIQIHTLLPIFWPIFVFIISHGLFLGLLFSTNYSVLTVLSQVYLLIFTIIQTIF